MKATRKYEDKTQSIEITLTRKVIDRVAYMDGYNLPDGREVFEMYEVKLIKKSNGATIKVAGKPGDFAFFKTQGKYSGKYPAGAHARIGDTYISKDAYDIAMRMITELDAEVGKSDEQIALEQEAEERRRIGEENLDMAAEETARRAHPGWCDKCHSYCYGDCEANS